MTDSKRLFVGARVSVATANALAVAAETLARRARDAGIDIRWVAPVSYHVTLKFLGHTRHDAIAAVCDALEAATASTPRITIRTARLGTFPAIERASVVWAGVEDSGGALAGLAGRIDAACTALGYAPEHRAFHGHVTLGRLRETRPVREVVLPVAEQMFGDTRLESIALYESETKPTGSVYRELRRIDFKTGPIDRSEPAKRQTAALDVEARSDPRVELEIETDDGWPRGRTPD